MKEQNKKLERIKVKPKNVVLSKDDLIDIAKKVIEKHKEVIDKLKYR
jgi:hypothetical protein